MDRSGRRFGKKVPSGDSDRMILEIANCLKKAKIRLRMKRISKDFARLFNEEKQML